jgi:chromosome segregation ATPase
MEPSSKRMKLSPNPPETGGISHISDSVVQSQLAERDAVISDLKNQVNFIRDDYKKLRKAFYGHERLLAEHQDNRRVERAARKRQENENEKLRKDLEQLSIDKQSLKEQLTERDEKMKAMQNEIDDLRNPGRTQQDADDLTKTRNRLKSLQGDYDYIQERFRDAQSSAAANQAELQEANKKIAKLEPLADGHIVEARRIARETSENMSRNYILQLQGQIANLNSLVRAKENQIDTLNRQRSGYGTRAGSVPRSPRVGTSDARSRAASPLPGSKLNQMHRDGDF